MSVPASRRVASRPSSRGIRMSISTTSGRRQRAGLDRLGAVARLADDLQVGLGVEDLAEAGADECLVVGDQHADGHAGSFARTV